MRNLVALSVLINLSIGVMAQDYPKLLKPSKSHTNLSTEIQFVFTKVQAEKAGLDQDRLALTEQEVQLLKQRNILLEQTIIQNDSIRSLLVTGYDRYTRRWEEASIAQLAAEEKVIKWKNRAPWLVGIGTVLGLLIN